MAPDWERGVDVQEAENRGASERADAFRVLVIEDRRDHAILLREALEATGPGVFIDECRISEISNERPPPHLTIVAPAAAPSGLERELVELSRRAPDPRVLLLADREAVETIVRRVPFPAVHTLSKRDGVRCLEQLTGIVRELREAQTPRILGAVPATQAAGMPLRGVFPLAGVIARDLLARLAAVDRAAEEALEAPTDPRGRAAALQRLRAAIDRGRKATQQLRDLVCDQDSEPGEAIVPLPGLLAARAAAWRAQLPAAVTLSLLGATAPGAPVVPARSFGLLMDELIRILGATQHRRITVEIDPRNPRRVLVTVEHPAPGAAAGLALAHRGVATLSTALEALGGTLTPPAALGGAAAAHQFVIELSDRQRWPAATRPAYAGRTVLAIGGDPSALARSALAPYGFTLALTDSTPAAESLLAAGCRYEFALLGVGSPGTGDIDAVRTLLARDPALQVVLVAAADDRAEALRAITAGALGYLDAPLNVLDLVVLARAMGGEPAGYRG